MEAISYLLGLLAGASVVGLGFGAGAYAGIMIASHYLGPIKVSHNSNTNVHFVDSAKS